MVMPPSVRARVTRRAGACRPGVPDGRRCPGRRGHEPLPLQGV